jgi:hypothetical protein
MDIGDKNMKLGIINEIRLEKELLSSQVEIDTKYYSLQNAKISSELEYHTHNLILRLDAYLLGRIIDTVEFKYPATWWDAFKEKYSKYFPEFYLIKNPVKYTVKTFSVKEYHPTLLANERGRDVYFSYVIDQKHFVEVEEDYIEKRPGEFSKKVQRTVRL